MEGAQGTDDKRRVLLEMVAEGKVTPEEAVKLLKATTDGSPARPSEALEGPVTAVKVTGAFRTVKITGDSSVEGAVAEGPHQVRLSEGTLIFEDDIIEDEDGSYILFGPGRVTRRKRFDVRINDRKFQWGEGFNPAHPPVLRIRMNPALPLTLELMAGTAKVSGVHSEIKAKIAAGTGKFEGVTGPLQIGVEAGSVHVDGKLTRGESEISCTAGKVRVQLDPSSDVHVVARSTLGRISLPPKYSKDPEWSGIGGAEREATIGNGAARLNLSAVTGSVQVEVGL